MGFVCVWGGDAKQGMLPWAPAHQLPLALARASHAAFHAAAHKPRCTKQRADAARTMVVARAHALARRKKKCLKRYVWL